MKWDKLREIFLQQQFEKLEFHNIHVCGYYKLFEDALRLFVILDNTTLRIYSESDLHRFEQMARESLEEAAQGSNVEILFLIYTEDILRDALLAKKFQCWFADVGRKRVMIFEDQPADFAGMEKLINTYAFAGTGNQKMVIPWITIGLILINVLIFICMEIKGSTMDDISYMVEHGASFWKLEYEQHEYYRWFTCIFLHFGIGHLFNNMLVLYLVGTYAEIMYGRMRYLLLYLSTGVLSSIASSAYYMMKDEAVVSVGASGAIYGIIGAFVIVLWINRRQLKGTWGRWGLILAVLIYSGMTGKSADTTAHISGFIGGIIMGGLLIFIHKMRKKKKGSETENIEASS